MITLKSGNILDAAVEALVNPVNTVGVMGKGLALQFRQAFPNNYAAYRQACKDQTLRIGTVLVVKLEREQPRYIINVPTKRHWRNPSRLDEIEQSLLALAEEIRRLAIQSIAIPALGSSLGQLDWSAVRPRIEATFAELPDVDVWLYPPHSP